VVNSKVQAAMRQATYLKLLAQEYMRSELYGPALDTLEEALIIEPRNQVLHQLSGVCAGFLAKVQTRPEARELYLARAETAYLTALEIDPDYLDGLYGLAALYHFEMGRHLEAIKLLDTLLAKAPGHVSGLFVLARSHVMLGNVDDAVAAYDRIIDSAADRGLATQARRNRQLLTGEAE
jgi:cytochrome c-type biogenesis protein CcmH/NrfG